MKVLIKKALPKFLLDYYYALWPFLGAVIYRFPSRGVKVIGITGTNGKTSVTHMASHILENAGFKVASISSIRFKIGDKEWTNKLKMTMPGRMKLQKFLRRAVRAKCDFVILEVTSEGIKQDRHKFIKFDTVAFTNLTREHIESHGSFEKYKEAKGQLFALPHRVSIVNLDDKSSEYFLQFDAEEKIGFALKRKDGNEHSKGVKKIIAQEVSMDKDGISFMVGQDWFDLPLMGKFNVYNALTATAIGVAQGISLGKINRALKTSKGIPGRMERVIGEPFSVIVDYAHTPDALEKAYKTITTHHSLLTTHSKLICVLGSAGGGRDKWKRPEMGKIAAKYCNEIILTDEDPYDEAPSDILKQISEGFSQIPNSPAKRDPGTRDKFSRWQSHRGSSTKSGQITNKNQKPNIKYQKILDRREAIHEALKKAKDGDAVIITGKGAEPLMMTKEGPINWDDREIVREEFKKIYF